MRRRAVFFDRDGVLNHNWYNPATKEWESPIRPGDFRWREGVLDALVKLQTGGHRMFLVSNQPSAAKGKCSLDDLASVHAVFVERLVERNIRFGGFFYAYSHPKAVVPGMTEPAYERKPNPYFIERAISSEGLDRSVCWMVGDRGTDIECGRRARVRTIQVKGSEPDGKDTTDFAPDFLASGLPEAIEIILGSA